MGAVNGHIRLQRVIPPAIGDAVRQQAVTLGPRLFIAQARHAVGRRVDEGKAVEEFTAVRGRPRKEAVLGRREPHKRQQA